MRRMVVSLLMVLAVLPSVSEAGLAGFETKPTAPPTPSPQPPPPTPTPKPPAPPTPEPVRVADPWSSVQPASSPTATVVPTSPSPTPTAISATNPPTSPPTPVSSTATSTPLPRRPTSAPSPAPVSVVTAADKALAWVGALPPWVPSAAGGAIGILLVTLIWWAVRYANYTRQHLRMQQKLVGESEAARLEDQRREGERVLSAEEKGWARLAGQIVADVLGESVQLSREIPPRVSGRPAPYFTVAGDEGDRYVFTIDVKAMQQVGLLPKRRIRSVRLGQAVEPSLIWRWLAERSMREPGDLIPALPRDAEWFLIAVRKRGVH